MQHWEEIFITKVSGIRDGWDPCLQTLLLGQCCSLLTSCRWQGPCISFR